MSLLIIQTHAIEQKKNNARHETKREEPASGFS